MPPKATKYSVKVQHPILRDWRTLATGLTKAQAKLYADTVIWNIQIVEETNEATDS